MKYLFGLPLVLTFSGCSKAVVDFIEFNQIHGQHDKAMKFLGTIRGDYGYVQSKWAKDCLTKKLEDRGFYLLQDNIDCYDKR